MAKNPYFNTNPYYEGNYSQYEMDRMFNKPGSFVLQDPINISGTVSSTKKSSAKSKPKDAPINKFGTSSKAPTKLATAPVNRFGTDAKAPDSPEVAGLKDIAAAEREGQAQARNMQLALASSKFFLDVLNANNAYRGQELSTMLNIEESKRLARESLFLADQRAKEARGEGVLAGESAALSLAAQGQDVQGDTVQRVVGSFQDVGEQNALNEEIAGIREALGYQLEEVSMLYELDQAKIDRDMAITSSALNLGVNAAVAFI